MPLQDPPLPGWMQGSPAVQTLARTLLARYPAAFRAAGAEVRPLKIGIDRDLQQALDVNPDPRAHLNKELRFWCNALSSSVCCNAE